MSEHELQFTVAGDTMLGRLVRITSPLSTLVRRRVCGALPSDGVRVRVVTRDQVDQFFPTHITTAKEDERHATYWKSRHPDRAARYT